MSLAEPIWARGYNAAWRGRTHDRIRTVTIFPFAFLELSGPFSNRISLVNSHLPFFLFAWPGSRFSPRSEVSAATSGSKHRRCNVHNGLAR